MGHVSIPRMSLSSCLPLTLCSAPLCPPKLTKRSDCHMPELDCKTTMSASAVVRTGKS